MKQLFLILLLAFMGKSYAQTAISADLYVGQPYLTDLGANTVNPNILGLSSTVKLNVDFLNLEQNKSIPLNTFQIVIGLGNKLQLQPGFNLATAPMSNYFTWMIANNNGQQQLIGTIN